MEKKYPRGKALAAYTGLFAVWALACYGVLLYFGRSLIWEIDGLMQHYTYMMYVGQWLRTAAGNLLSGQPAPMFDFALGFGEDVLATVNYYGFGDPTMLLAALFTGVATEMCYTLILMLRVWCAGAACMALGRKLGLGWRQSVMAGVIYAFSLTLFTSGTTGNAMFANPYYQFPLMLLGLECVFERKKSWMLSLTVALSAVCGFYFLYANTLLLLVYALVRHFTMGHERPVRALPAVAGRAIGWYCLGIGLSAVVLLPALVGFLGAQRTSAGVSMGGVHWRYGLRTYLNFPLSALTSQTNGGVPFMPALVMLGAVLLMIRRGREYRGWKAMLAVSLALLLTPLTGYVLNGFTYAINRWTYAVYLALALAAGRMLPELFRLSKREGAALAAFAALAAVYAAVLWRRGLHSREMLLQLAVLLVSGAAVLAVNRWENLRRPAALGLAALLLVNMTVVHYVAGYSKRGVMVPAGEGYARVMEDSFRELPGSDGLQRIDADVQTSDLFNASAMTGQAATSVYNSLISGRCYAFMLDVAAASVVQSNAIAGLDGRAALEALWSVDRFACEKDAPLRVPYGFEPEGETENLRVFRNTLALPAGYAQTAWMSSEDYAALSPLEKQWALLQCAVTDEKPDGMAQAQPEQSWTELEIADVEMENIERDGDHLTVGKDAVIRLTFDAPADCELYLQMNGLRFTTGQNRMDNLMYLRCGAAESSVLLMRDGVTQDLRRPYYLVNLGYDAAARRTAEIRFEHAGEYRLGEMRLYAQPMADFASLVGALRERSMQDVRMGTDEITGTIALDAPAMVVFSIPYSGGWSLEANGQDVPLTASADTFLACELPAGDYELRLRYETPLLKVGGAISALSLAAMVGLSAVGRRRRKRGAGA